jgi:hypothetical protein
VGQHLAGRDWKALDWKCRGVLLNGCVKIQRAALGKLHGRNRRKRLRRGRDAKHRRWRRRDAILDIRDPVGAGKPEFAVHDGGNGERRDVQAILERRNRGRDLRALDAAAGDRSRRPADRSQSADRDRKADPLAG